MKKAKKYIILFLISLTTILGIQVKAGIKDSVLVKNRIDGIYAIAPLNDKTHLYYLQMYTLNGITSYCIEMGKDITTEIYNSTENEIEQINISKLNKEQLDYIKAVAYFGYGYKTHIDNKYYMATQEIIWEYLNNIDITWTTELDINGPKINIDSFKEEIINLATKYLKPLNLPQTATYPINSNINISIASNNSMFYTVNSQNNNQVYINNNNLNIITGKEYQEKDIITLTRNNDYNEQSKLYSFENSQIMLSVGNLAPLEHKLEITLIGATLNLELIDKDTKKYESEGVPNLNNSIYELYNTEQNYTKKITISNQGTAKVTNLSYGTYYIKLIKPGKGYKSTNEEIKITINKLNNQITLEQEKIKNSIEINKMYEKEEGCIREENIKFEVYDSNNNLYQNIITTKYGPDIITLPYGEYTIKQINTTEGYEKVNDIKIKVDKEIEDIIKYDLLDKIIKAKIHIITINKNTNKQIEEENIQYKIFDRDNEKYILNNDNEILNTNKKGEILIELPYGNYTLEQITQPINYLENKEIIEFTIKSPKQLEIKYYNIPKIPYLKEKTKNPQTSDKIKKYIIISIISFIFLVIFLYKKIKKLIIYFKLHKIK